MAARKKAEKVDGLGPREIARIRSAIREVWQRSSLARKLVVDRCLNFDASGFSTCEGCKAVCAKVLVDHITPVGEVDGGFIARLFCSSKQLQGLCKRCHDAKTKAERAAQRAKLKKT